MNFRRYFVGGGFRRGLTLLNLTGRWRSSSRATQKIVCCLFQLSCSSTAHCQLLPSYCYGAADYTFHRKLPKRWKICGEWLINRNDIMGGVTDFDSSFPNLEHSAKQRDDAQSQNEELANELDQTLRQRDDLEKEVEYLRRIAKETEHKFNALELKIIGQKPLLSQHLIYISKAQEYLEKILKMFSDAASESQTESVSDQAEYFSDQADSSPEDLENIDGDLQASVAGARVVSELALTAEEILRNYRENCNKVQKELENSIANLREENRDIRTLLRSALAEKEAAKKAFSKSRGGVDQKHAASTQRKGAIFQIAERGLQKVGFGFMVGAESLPFDAGESENEGDDEVSGLAFAMENIIKSLRLEISELQQSLEASRAEANYLRELSGAQAQDLARNKLRIKELEDRESTLTENVEGLMMDIAAAEEEISRWKEACELEAEAGKAVMEECQEEIATLKRELEETRNSLNRANNTIKSKEALAAAAMIARDAAERSLHLADSRTAALRERIEELIRQFEEIHGRSERNSLARVRYVCWPWRWLKITPIGNYRHTRGYTAAEMEELLDPPT